MSIAFVNSDPFSTLHGSFFTDRHLCDQIGEESVKPPHFFLLGQTSGVDRRLTICHDSWGAQASRCGGGQEKLPWHFGGQQRAVVRGSLR